MMRDYLEPMLGATGALIAQFVITLAVIVILILIVFWLIRRLSNGRFGSSSSRGRQPRLQIVDALPVDSRRRLILVRRDNVEHLIMIGGTTDVVVESSVLRAPPQGRRLEPQRNAPPPATPPTRMEPVRTAPEPRRPEPAQAAFEPELPQRTIPPAPIMPETASTETFFATVAQAETGAEPLALPSSPQRPTAQPRRSSAIPSFLSTVRNRQTPTIPKDAAVAERSRTDSRQDLRPEPRQDLRPDMKPDLPRAPSLSEEAPRAAIRPDPIEQRRSGPRSRPVEAPSFDAPASRATAPDTTPRYGDSELLAPEPVRPAVIRQNPLMTSARQPAPPPLVAPQASLPADDFPPYEPIFAIDDDGRGRTGRAETSPTGPQLIDEAPVVHPPMPEDEPAAMAREERIEPQLTRDAEPDESPVGDLEREMARLLGEISSTRK